MCRLKNGNKSGVLVVEASIVVTLVVAVITVMLYIGMVMYRQTLSSVMANQTASNIAAVYGNNLKDPVTGYIEPDKVYQTVTYGNMKTDAYTDVVRQKGEQLAVHSLNSSNILASESTEVDVDIVKKSGELLKSQIVVTIKDKYKVPLVGLFGIDGTVEFSATGYADCVDVLEYVNGVDAVSDTKNSNLTLLPDLDVCNVIFIPDESDLTSVYTVAVARGESILSSNKYTGSVMPSEPSNAKYNFAGWVDAYGTDFTATRTVNSDITVYGKWMCSVTLNANGGTVGGDTLPYVFSVPRNSRTHLFEATRTGYEFEGWYTEKNGGGIQYLSNDTEINENVTLYANWKCSHPSRVENGRTGNVCEGGIIYYKCAVCGVELEPGEYEGKGHNYSMRCNVLHSLGKFDGTEKGGCGGYHVEGQECETCGITHDKVYGSHIVCSRCHEVKKGSYWCMNEHVPGNRRTPDYKLH